MNRMKSLVENMVWAIRDLWLKLGATMLGAVLLYLVVIGSDCHVADIKAHAAQALAEKGFTIFNYEGWQRSGILCIWGGQVWYNVKRKDDASNHLYNLFLSKRGDEYHVYNLRCVDCAVVQQ